METNPGKHECSPENAAKMRQWIQERGGVAIWRSVNLANPGASWSTPAKALDGSPTTKPTWEAESQPACIITDPAQIEVVTRREVRRFRVGVRMGSQGMSLKLTDASSRRVREACAKAGKDASYAFDHETQEAVITVPDKCVPLSKWVE